MARLLYEGEPFLLYIKQKGSAGMEIEDAFARPRVDAQGATKRLFDFGFTYFKKWRITQ